MSLFLSKTILHYISTNLPTHHPSFRESRFQKIMIKITTEKEWKLLVKIHLLHYIISSSPIAMTAKKCESLSVSASTPCFPEKATPGKCTMGLTGFLGFHLAEMAGRIRIPWGRIPMVSASHGVAPPSPLIHKLVPTNTSTPCKQHPWRIMKGKMNNIYITNDQLNWFLNGQKMFMQSTKIR